MDMLDPPTVSNVDEKGFVPDEVRNAFFRKLRMKNENRSCFECTARNPTWISLSYGVYLCLECSGEHRRKGVHISFVRSVELDRFTPEQMVQMGVGGNGKAWEFFKQHGMGKLSDGGRHIDYNSNITKRYKAQMEKETAAHCEKLGFTFRAPTQAPATPAVPSLDKSKSDPVDEFADFTPGGQVPEASQLARGKSAPASSGGYPKASPSPSPKAHTPVAAPAPKAQAAQASQFHSVSASSVTDGAKAVSSLKPAGFAAKQKAKEIDFDFDFDDLEKEASKPPPAPIPQASPTPAAPAAPMRPAPAPAAARSGAAPDSSVTSKYAGKKGISSDDFFHQEEQESAYARLERESRYQKFAGSGAISSSSFFGNGDENMESKVSRGNSGDNVEELKEMARKGGEIARAGISRGAELLSSYLNKARN